MKKKFFSTGVFLFFLYPPGYRGHTVHLITFHSIARPSLPPLPLLHLSPVFFFPQKLRVAPMDHEYRTLSRDIARQHL